jgi:hypothetical protein
MKTAVSIPDALFAQADRLARRRGRTRSALFSDALAEYVARHEPSQVTAAMDQVCDRLDAAAADPMVRAAARQVLERSEW